MDDDAPRATLADVARAARVSKATASKVLNKMPSVAEPTRRRVEHAMEELGYAPRRATGPREVLNRVVVVFSSLTRPYATEVLDGIITAARDLEVEVVVDVLDPVQDDGHPGPFSAPWLTNLARLDRTGLIVVTTELGADAAAQISAAGITTVHIDPVNPLDDTILSVGSTNFTGGVQATQHLVALGHRRIGFIGGLEKSVPARERMQGYRTTLYDNDIPIDPTLVADGLPFTVESGIRLAERLLALPDPPTAVFAGSDMSALGVFEAARRRGLRIPEDVSVVGFDDSMVAAVMAPPLTTVRQPVTDMGRVALRTLFQQARGERPDSHHVQLATELVVRQSCRRL